jgi:hypothetical protein
MLPPPSPMVSVIDTNVMTMASLYSDHMKIGLVQHEKYLMEEHEPTAVREE